MVLTPSNRLNFAESAQLLLWEEKSIFHVNFHFHEGWNASFNFMLVLRDGDYPQLKSQPYHYDINWTDVIMYVIQFTEHAPRCPQRLADVWRVVIAQSTFYFREIDEETHFHESVVGRWTYNGNLCHSKAVSLVRHRRLPVYDWADEFPENTKSWHSLSLIKSDSNKARTIMFPVFPYKIFALISFHERLCVCDCLIFQNWILFTQLNLITIRSEVTRRRPKRDVAQTPSWASAFHWVITRCAVTSNEPSNSSCKRNETKQQT